MSVHLAQVNVSKLRHPVDSDAMAGFFGRLDEINALADASPGFVWRHVGESGYEQGGAFSDDELVNLSVWEDIESLMVFVHGTGHRAMLARRAEWFHRPRRPALAMWWVPEGHVPDLVEAARRLDRLRKEGPSPEAFDAVDAFDPEGVPITSPPATT